MGIVSGSGGNTITVSNGGAFNFSGSDTGRTFAMGKVAKNNVMTVTGAGSALTVSFDLPMSVGGSVTGGAPGTITMGDTGNHLDVFSGGRVTPSNTCLYLLGSDSAFNLGDGISISTAKCVAYTGYVDIDALGPVELPNDTTKNYRIATLGTSGPVPISAATTNINTLTHNVTTDSTIDTLGGTLRVGTSGGVLISKIGGPLTIGTDNALGSGQVTVSGCALAMQGFSYTVGAVTITSGSITGAGGTLTSTGGFTLNIDGATNITAHLAGSVGLTKSGVGIATLEESGSYSGDTTVAAGTLSLWYATLDDASVVTIAGGALLELASSEGDTVDKLFLNGVQMPAGTYGSTSSAATTKNNRYFSSTGTLNVLTGPPAVIADLAIDWGSSLAGLWTAEVPITQAGGSYPNGVVVSVNQAATPDAATVTIPAANAVNGKLFARFKSIKP